MNKDVIYIDVDDDVTAIIGKNKKTKEKSKKKPYKLKKRL